MLIVDNIKVNIKQCWKKDILNHSLIALKVKYVFSATLVAPNGITNCFQTTLQMPLLQMRPTSRSTTNHDPTNYAPYNETAN